MVGRLRQDEFRVNTDEGRGNLHVERFAQTKVEGGLSAKTIRNLLLVLQAILSLAVDNDLIARSPISDHILLERGRIGPRYQGV